MSDLTVSALQAVAGGDARAIPLTFLCGIVTSPGPCVATRMLMVGAAAARNNTFATSILTASFVGGLCVAYVAFAIGGSLLWRVAEYSGYAYVGTGACLAAAGAITLFRGSSCAGRHDARAVSQSLSSMFLFGIAAAITISPCCTPLVASAAAYSANAGVLYAGAIAAAYALGHSVPLFVGSHGLRWVNTSSLGNLMRPVSQVISGALMLAFAAFYWVMS